MRARLGALLCVALLLAGCSSDDDEPESSSTTTTTEETTTTTEATTSTTAFGGQTEPLTSPNGTATTAFLTDVTVEREDGFDRITFEFRDVGVPAVALEYVEEAIADGSGERVEVEGEALLQVRMEPAMSADLSGEEVVRTYDGPDRVEGQGQAVTEVVRTGDFEAVLTWVVGVRSRAPFKLMTLPDPSRVVVEVAAG